MPSVPATGDNTAARFASSLERNYCGADLYSSAASATKLRMQSELTVQLSRSAELQPVRLLYVQSVLCCGWTAAQMMLEQA
jgi:hypothetical protein